MTTNSAYPRPQIRFPFRHSNLISMPSIVYENRVVTTDVMSITASPFILPILAPIPGQVNIVAEKMPDKCCSTNTPSITTPFQQMRDIKQREKLSSQFKEEWEAFLISRDLPLLEKDPNDYDKDEFEGVSLLVSNLPAFSGSLQEELVEWANQLELEPVPGYSLGMSSRNILETQYMENNACVTLQTFGRRLLATKSVERKRVAAKVWKVDFCARSIQKSWQSFVTKRDDRRLTEILQGRAAVTVQSRYRAFAARFRVRMAKRQKHLKQRQYEASTMIQTNFRGFRVRKRIRLLTSS